MGPDVGVAAGSFCRRPMVGYSCEAGVWGCCAAHRRQASSYTDRIRPGVCALPVASNFLRNAQFIRTLENLRKQPPRNKVPQSPEHRRRDLGRSESKGASAPSLHRRRFFCARDVVLWRWCAGHLRVCRAPFVPVGQPAYCCHLNLLGRERWQFHHERNSCMTTVSPLLNLASVLLRRSSTTLSYFTVSQSRFTSAQSEARHD